MSSAKSILTVAKVEYDWLAEFCQICISSSLFWILVSICTIAEPLSCSHRPVGANWQFQIAMVVVNSAFFLIQIIGDMTSSDHWKSRLREGARTGNAISFMYHFGKHLFKDGKYALELTCLSCAWIFMPISRGVAVLRCFRVFRLLWLYEIKVFTDYVTFIMTSMHVNPDFIERMFEALHFCKKGLQKLGNEMFLLTRNTRGGLFLMLTLFYCAFVFGAALWVETGDSNNDDASGGGLCNTLDSCIYTMLRLTFFDGNGFDYAYSLTSNHKFLFFLVMCYLCVTSFGIINGLIGIFGSAFTDASEATLGKLRAKQMMQRQVHQMQILNKSIVKHHEKMIELTEVTKPDSEQKDNVVETAPDVPKETASIPPQVATDDKTHKESFFSMSNLSGITHTMKPTRHHEATPVSHDSVDEKLQEMHGSIDGMDNMTSFLRTTAPTMDDLPTFIMNLDSKILQMIYAIGTITDSNEKKLKTLNGKVDGINVVIDNVKGEVMELKSEIAVIKGLLMELMNKKEV